MCMEFWFDLADVYEVLLFTNVLPRSATHHTFANEHDELRRSVDLPGCLSSHRRRRFDQMVKTSDGWKVSRRVMKMMIQLSSVPTFSHQDFVS